MKKKWSPFAYLTAVAAFAALGGMLAVVDAHAAVDIDTAQSRIRSTMDKVQIQPSKFIGDNREQPSIPNLKGVNHQVPDIRDYGHLKNTDVDPMNIAKRYQHAEVDVKAAEQGDLLVFVSFSMPEASLKRIAHETAKAGGAMVIRGFKDNSLKATINAAQEIAALQGDLLIHPDLFDHYNVTEVPTTVIARSGDKELESCSGNTETGLCTEHLQVRGDVSLHAALEYFIDKQADNKLTQIAEAKLAKLNGAK